MWDGVQVLFGRAFLVLQSPGSRFVFPSFEAIVPCLKFSGREEVYSTYRVPEISEGEKMGTVSCRIFLFADRVRSYEARIDADLMNYIHMYVI